MFNKGQRFSTAFQGSVLILTLDTFGKNRMYRKYETTVLLLLAVKNMNWFDTLLECNDKNMLFACVGCFVWTWTYSEKS